ncbi:MAG TPA: endonuclease/exonuclease/phosphatase family protein, partial [Acidimicrobiales bacterium]
YPGEGSWQAEQRSQIDRLVALIAEKAPAGAPVVVLGDLNAGPALSGIAGEAPENYAVLPASGLAVPYVDAPAPECTFCADNPLVGGADDDQSVLIDHVMVRGLRSTGVDRVLDQPVLIGTSESRLSDHYGVKVALAAP